MSAIRILIADDHPLFRLGLRAILSAEPDMQVVGEATNGDEAVRTAGQLAPDVILMDINLPKKNGLEAIQQILIQNPSMRILVVTMLEDDTVLAAMRSGAHGYLLKGAEGEEILRAIRTVASGGMVFSPGVSERVTSFVSRNPAKNNSAFPELTRRELEILEMMSHGLTNTAIATRLVISPKTLRNSVSTIYRKLQVTSRGEAIAKAHAAGVRSLPSSE